MTKPDPMSVQHEPASPIRRQVVTASVWVTAGMLLGRFAGIVREFLIADTFGVTRDADVAILLVTGPEVLVTIAGSGAVGLVLIPILLEQSVGSQLQLIRRLSLQLGMAAILLAIVSAGMVLGLGSSWATEGGLTERAFRTAVVVSAIAVPTSMLVVITSAFLRAQNRFAAVSLSTVTFTLPILVAIVAFRSVIGVAIGIAAGGALRYGIQALLIARGWEGGQADSSRPPVKRSDVETAFGISVLQAAQVSLPILIVAALGDEGDVALLNYGWRVLLIPIGLLASVFSVAAYPSIVRLLQDGSASSPGAVRSLLRPVISLSVIMAAWIWVYARPAIDAVYQRAGLDDAALGTIARGLRAGVVAVPLITIGSAATTVLFGLQRSREGLTPYLLATPMLLVLGALLHAGSGTPGVMLAVAIYGAAFGVIGALVLARSEGFALMRVVDTLTVVVVAVAGVSLAYGLRALLPDDGLVALTMSGSIYVVLCVGVWLGLRSARIRSR